MPAREDRLKAHFGIYAHRAGGTDKDIFRCSKVAGTGRGVRVPSPPACSPDIRSTLTTSADE